MPTLSPYPHSPARSLRPASRSPARELSRSALLSLFTLSLLILGLPLLAGCGDSDAQTCASLSPCQQRRHLHRRVGGRHLRLRLRARLLGHQLRG